VPKDVQTVWLRLYAIDTRHWRVPLAEPEGVGVWGGAVEEEGNEGYGRIAEHSEER
jgi:hypothetical protein